MSMNCKTGSKVVVKKGAKQAHFTAKGQRDHVTVNCCVSANGQTIPSAPYKSEGIANALYGKSENGYMDEVLV